MFIQHPVFSCLAVSGFICILWCLVITPGNAGLGSFVFHVYFLDYPSFYRRSNKILQDLTSSTDIYLQFFHLVLCHLKGLILPSTPRCLHLVPGPTVPLTTPLPTFIALQVGV